MKRTGYSVSEMKISQILKDFVECYAYLEFILMIIVKGILGVIISIYSFFSRKMRGDTFD